MKRQTKFEVTEHKAPQNWNSYIYDIDMLTFCSNKDNPNVDDECRTVDDVIYKQILKNFLKMSKFIGMNCLAAILIVS